ncbi:hypothetical protein ULMS_21400 [Patiriisocius marinistellae]|uniref:Phosphoglycerate mutase n=1 Tax=Patiriisocius marinistellae TaxID=2494560 RepID=A0A5J4FZG1_9FLAO|nr:phosphoglycerate mutase family protein [Patiriisocius marinistellae]GEQ86632.1 hypothetical protein ULMS_21400 [Patiriisocius marinistellae]
MKNWVFILFLAVASMSCQENKNEQKEADVTAELKDDSIKIPESTITTFYLIRHADKDTRDVKSEDPPLTEEGKKRAESWAEYFSNEVINAIYTTNYDRTRHTIFYLARDKDISAELYYPGELFNNQFLNKVQGQTAVIVGHSNTIPQLVNRMIGEEKFSDIDDNDYDNLYVVTFKGNTATAIVKDIN